MILQAADAEDLARNVYEVKYKLQSNQDYKISQYYETSF